MTFLRGFGFFKVGRPKVRLAKHIPIVRFQYYRYQFSLEYPARPGLVQALTSISKQTRVINSAYGNPYQCRITNFRVQARSRDKSTIVFSFGGEARKIHSPASAARRTVRSNNKFGLLHKQRKLK